MQTEIIDTKKIRQAFISAASDFILLLEKVPEDRLNTAPFEGSWTPGQVADHVTKFLSGIAQVQKSPQVAPGRPVDQYEPAMRAIFLDFERKATAPPNVVPGSGPFDRQQQVALLKEISAVIETHITETWLGKICAGIPFPTLAELTGLEWIYFGTYHLQRHTHQLETICLTDQVF